MSSKRKQRNNNMSKNSEKKVKESAKEVKDETSKSEKVEVNDIEDVDAEDVEVEAEVEDLKDETSDLEKENAKLKEELEKSNKEYLFLMAEFDNFRKRTIKEKAEIIKNGAENAMKEILPIIDDFERGLEAIEKADDVASVKDGIELIYNKFVKYLDRNGVKAIETKNGADFDTEFHDAITTFPTEDETLKGKIIDTVQKGYKLNDKVLRHSKVVVGQ